MKLGGNMKAIQFVMLCISVGLFAVVWISAVYWIALSFGVLLGVMNWMWARTYDIHVRSNVIVISNLYRTRTATGHEFNAIVPADKLFFRSPMYFSVKLNDGSEYLFADTSFKALFSVVDQDKYIGEMNAYVKIVLQ